MKKILVIAALLSQALYAQEPAPVVVDAAQLMQVVNHMCELRLPHVLEEHSYTVTQAQKTDLIDDCVKSHIRRLVLPTY